MADIVADIASIQDEDQLRHMWSNTEDFAKKKEIRVRLYKLRESRLKLNYSNEDNTNVSSYNRSSSNLIQDTNRKHTATKTFDTIQDQGYMSLKSKEIRDSESPTRDIHGKIIRNDSYNNKSYDIRLMDNTVVLPNSQDWTTSQKSNYSTNVDGNTVTESAERQSSAVLAKDNENITLNSQEKQAFSTTDNSKDGNIDKSTTLQESADLVQNSSYQDDNTSFQAVSKQKQEASATSSVKQIGNVTSYTTSSRTVSSKASSSKTVTSSSKIISSKGLAIESGDDFVDKTLSIKQNEIDDEVQSNLNYNTRKTSKVDRTVRKRSSTASLSDAIQKRNSLTSSQIHDVNESDYNADVSDTTDIRSSRIVENRTDSSSSIQSSKIIKNQSDNSSKVETLKTIQDATDADEYVKRQNLKNSDINVSKSEVIKSDQTYNKSSYDNSRKLTENEKITDSTRIDTVEGDTSPTKHKSDVSDVKMYNSRKDIKTSHLTNVNTTSTTENKNVDQNIMTELSNLDSYLSTHPTSTPASPRSAVTDIDYQDARRAPVKHPSTLDLPKECTEGQYVTTYNDSYKNRISTNYDVSPTHNAFASSLRADTPERSPSSPTRAFSTDRKSPRSSPEKYNTRSVSENRYRKSPEKTPTRDSPNRFSKESPERKSVRSSPDRYQSRKSPERTPTRELPSRKSPERTPNRSSPNMTRLSPTKSPVDSKFSKQPITTSPTRKSPERSYNKLDNATETTRKAQDRRMSSSSYTIETKKDTNKSKRKFSSAQSKDAAKKRISTPKVSPDTSPTRDGNTSDSSNNSQGTYNTSTRKTQDVTRIDSQDTYGVTQNTYTGTTEYTRSDSHDTYNKYRRDSTDTYNKDETDRNESRNSYTIGTEEDTHEFERSDSTDSFNVKKLRKDSKDITKQELKQRKLFSESENQNVKTTRTNDFIKTEISENAQQNSYTSPSVSPVRQKSPEYSSEGSITKEIKLVNSLTDKNLTLIEQAEEINTETSASVTPCTSPDSYQTAPRRPSILKKKATDSQMNQESKTQTFAFESQKTPQQSPVRTSPTSPAKSFIDDEAVKNKTERKSSILKSTSKFENKEEIYDTKTAERKSSILKSPVKEKSPERNLEKGHAIKDEYEITVTEQSRKSPTRESSTRARKSPSPTKSPRESPTRSTLSIESRLTSPTQASLIREQKISESFDFTVKERRSPTKSPLREDAPRQPSPQKSTVRDTKSPEKTRRTPVREKASPQRVPSKPVEKRPTRKSSIPRAESLKSINKKPALTPSRQQTPKVALTTPKVSPVTPKTTAPTPKVTPSKTPSQRSLTPQQSKSSIKTTPQKFPVTSRTNSANISKTSTLVKTNSYSSRRATEPVKQAKPVTPAVQTKIPTKAPVKQAPQVVSKQPSTKKLPVKSPKGTKELKTNVTKKQNKTTINIEEEIRASNKTLEDILNKEQQAYYDSEIDSEVPPEEFLVEDDDDFCELTGSTRTESKSFFSSKQDQIRKEKVEQQDSSSDEENENIRITKAKRVDEKLTNTQNEDLLSVVVQLPNSSRESTPGVKNTGAQQVPYTSDINQPARYADYYSEPETDNEKTIKSVETSQYEQVTDLDEEAIDLNVSVADRVNKFLNSTRSEVDKENNQSVIEKKSVSQAKNLFENIAKSQSSPNYNENITKTHVKTLSSRQPVSEDVCETKNYYEVNHTEKRTTNDFINVEKDSISHDELVKKSPKDIYLEKTNHSSTTPQKPGKVAQPHKKLFDDTYYIEKNKRKQEDIEKTNLNKTTIDSCDEYIEINEQYDVKKKSPKDIYLEKTQKSSSKTNVVEIQKKPTDVGEEKKPEVKQFKRVPSTTLNNTKSKKNFFEEKINIEAEKSKSTLKTNKSTDKVFKSDKRSPVRQSPTRKSPENNEPKTKSPARQSPTRKSPEKVKRKYDTRKDSLMEIRASNIIAERRTKFSPLKENQTEPVGRRVTKSVSSKENIKPNEKKSDRRSAERKSQEKTTTTTSKTISNDIPQDKFTKERKPSVERVQRKSSSKFEERRASFEKKTVTERKVSSEIKQSERRISSDRTATESRKSKSKSPEPKANKDRSSPARKVSSKTSLDFEAKPAQKIDSFNNKFGVALKKTSNTSSTNVTTKSNTNNVLKASNKNTATTTDSIFDIESIFDLELLEKMLEKAVGYDQRRRLRTQIREVKKVQDETINKKSTSPSRNTNQKKSFIEEKQQKEFQSSTISSAAKTFQQSSPTQYGPTPAKKSSTGYEPTRPVDKAAPSQEKRNSYTRNDTTETSVVQRKGSSEYSQTSTYTTSQVREETCTDSITSSYGVGPTDENGRPLFGLKALRRTNTNKALVDDDFTNSSSVQITEEETEEFGGLKDSSGRPLFGGLRALKLADMPEQPPTSQLKDLVQKHEKSARDAAAVPLLRTDKPKAKFRRSFILDEEKIEAARPEDGRSPSAPVSLKSLWLNGQEVKLGGKSERGQEDEDTTVVSSRTSMKTDSSGKVTVTRDTMAGEISVKDNEEPKGKLIKAEYKFNKTSADDKGVSEAKTTTAILNGKNIKDSQITESLKLTDHNRTNNFIENEKKSSFRKTDSSSSFKENQESGTEKRKKSDSNATFVSKRNAENEKRFSKTDSSSSFSSKQVVESSSTEKRSNYRKTDSSSSVTRQDGEDDVEVEVRRKPVVRGDSVRALQNKFQQATVSSSMKSATPALSNESKAVTSSNQSSKTVTSNGTTSTTTTKSSSTRTETFSTVTKGSSSYADSEEEDGSDRQRGNMIEDDGIGNSSAALVSRIEKQRVASTTSETRSDSRQKLDLSDVDLISDESQLRILLDACSDYEGRRKIRARLRDVMAENNGALDTSSTAVTTNGNNVTKTEVRSRVLSQTATTHRLTKANSVQVSTTPASPFAKFKQLERQNSAPNSRTESPKLVRSASSIKETMLNWVKAQTAEYKNVQIDNFSTSWNDGMAFCALIHHFYPNAFDFDQLSPKQRRHNFELAFRVAEEQADLMPLLDVEDMVIMKRPDWKCVFTYVQTFYRRFHSDPRAMKVY